MVLYKKVSLFGQQDKYQLSKGFSLLETTIAVAILVSAVIGPMALSSQSIHSASVTRDTIMASNLAQEGVELVKNIRLNNRIRGRSWTQGLSSCLSTRGCFIDAKDLNVRGCSFVCNPLKFDSSLNLYNYNSGQDTIFTRIISILNVTSDEINVQSVVRWSDKFGNHFFTLSTTMFNW